MSADSYGLETALAIEECVTTSLTEIGFTTRSTYVFAKDRSGYVEISWRQNMRESPLTHRNS